MSRIEGVPAERAGLLARIAYWFARRKVGRVTGPLQVMAHSNAILSAVGGFELGLERARRVPSNLMALASLRTSTLVGCPF